MQGGDPCGQVSGVHEGQTAVSLPHPRHCNASEQNSPSSSEQRSNFPLNCHIAHGHVSSTPIIYGAGVPNAVGPWGSRPPGPLRMAPEESEE
ncbi:unnamed protein product [Lota lota]